MCSLVPVSAKQSDVTSLTVTVIDSYQALIPFAKVSIKGDSDFQQTINTNHQGIANFTKLSPGKYRLHIEANNFESREQELLLKVGHNSITLGLEIVQIRDELTVKQDEREKRTDPRSDTFTTILTQEQIDNLPDDPEEMEAALKAMAGPGAIIRVDGFTGGRIPSKSQIRQIRFRRSSFAAEDHGVGVAWVEILTKPNAGSWHGSIGTNFRHQAFDARNAMVPIRLPEGMQRFEASLDIPIRPNQTSLFLSVDQKQSHDAKTIFAALPSSNLNDVVRQPSNSLFASARFNHILTKNHFLRVNFLHHGSRLGNLGVGNFSLPERAFSMISKDYRWQVSESGTIGEKLFHQFLMQLHRRSSDQHSMNASLGLIVPGAFIGGGAQVHNENNLDELEIREDFDFAWKQHSLRAGVLIEAGVSDNINLNNDRGTFTFNGLDDYRSGRPAIFTQRVNINPVKYSHHQIGAYWQDDWRIVNSLTLSYGIRYERQNNLQDKDNFAPRLGLGWSPFKNGRTTIRGGLGIFYEWLKPEIVTELFSEDGHRGTNLVIINPGFPDPFTGRSQIILPPSRSQAAVNLHNPYIIQGSLYVQRQLPHRMSMWVDYSYQRGFHLFRGRNINAPISGIGRPDPSVGNLVLLESSARSFLQSIKFSIDSSSNKRFYWYASYVFSKNIDEADGPFSLPANNYDLRKERGPAANDMRHQLTVTTGLALIKGWRIAPTLSYRSSLPYSITTGLDNNGDTSFNDRPSGVGRNSARGNASWNVNTRLSWLFGFGGESSGGSTKTITIIDGDSGSAGSQMNAQNKKWRFNFYLQATNLFNHFNPTNFVGVMTSPFFGRPIAAEKARQIETGILISF